MSMLVESSQVNARIAKLEQQLTWSTRMGVVACLVLGACLVWLHRGVTTLQANPFRDTVEAGNFVLRDTSGQLRAALGVASDGQAGLFFTDTGGKARIQLGVMPDERPYVFMLDQKDHQRFAASLTDDGTPDLRLNDSEGGARLLLVQLADGSSNFVVSDERGRARITLGEGAGVFGMSLIDANDKARAGLDMLTDGFPRLRILDAQGNPRVMLAGGDSPGLTLFDRHGLRAALATLDDGTARLSYFDNTRRVTVVQ